MSLSPQKLWRSFFTEDVQLLDRLIVIWEKFPKVNLKIAWDLWQKYLLLLAAEKKRKEDARRAREVLAVLKSSKRGKRDDFDKNIIRKYLLHYTGCIPIKQMTKAEVDQLCNEIDFVKSFGRTVIFLQGDYGNR